MRDRYGSLAKGAHAVWSLAIGSFSDVRPDDELLRLPSHMVGQAVSRGAAKTAEEPPRFRGSARTRVPVSDQTTRNRDRAIHIRR